METDYPQYHGDEPSVDVLEVIPNRYPTRRYLIKVTCTEFTCVCPKTGQPDFAEILIHYIPKNQIVELKSLKLYLFAFRNKGIFHEAVTNKILEDFVAACEPIECTVIGKFGITARLFKLVSDMPRDQQLILLKQLVGNGVCDHLFKLIVEMTEEQQVILLEQMGQLPPAEIPVRTVSLEGAENSMRENPRKSCLINADYRIQDRNFNSYLLDISIGGVYIESDTRFPLGGELLIKFSLPNRPQPFTFSGTIAWSSDKGFGLKFDKISEMQSDIIKSFVEQNE